MKHFIIALSVMVNSLLCMAQTVWHTNPVGAAFAREGGETPEGIFKLTSGGYEVYTIVTSDKAFQPASLYYGADNADKEKVDAMVPDGKVPTAMNCFLIKTPEGYIMIDAGLPASKGGKTIERMAALNVTPEQISAIFLTHSHFDHIGGLIDDNGEAAFRNATVYASSAEVSLEPIAAAYKERFVTFEPGELLPFNVLPISAKGHTPGHTAFRLGNLLFVGDIVHGPSIQLVDPAICAGYDADKAQSVSTRNRILSYAVANSLTVLGAHVPGNGVIF